MALLLAVVVAAMASCVSDRSAGVAGVADTGAVIHAHEAIETSCLSADCFPLQDGTTNPPSPAPPSAPLTTITTTSIPTATATTVTVVIPPTSLASPPPTTSQPRPSLSEFTLTLEVDGIAVPAVIHLPPVEEVDVLLLYHGTVDDDRRVLGAALTTLDAFRGILDRDDMLLISVAYPQHDLLMGDNLRHAEAALRWVRLHASSMLGVRIDRVFLAGHSQGGYLVTRLNTMHRVDGVIASAPGPLDLVYRCSLEESGHIPPSPGCGNLAAAFGSTIDEPDAYWERSLLSFVTNHRSEILFIQGLSDSPIQMRSWGTFRQLMERCFTLQGRAFVEVEGFGHDALVRSALARAAINDFLHRPN